MYEEIRRAVLVKGISKREVAKIYGINRRTVDKMCKYSIPPGYQNKKGKKYPKIGDYKEKIDKILKEDLEIGKKQRHTSKRIYDRLRKEDGYSGSYDAVRRYVSEHKQVKKEVYIPLEHKYGRAQCDFGECEGNINGEDIKIYFFVMTLCKSGDTFAKAYFAEDQIAWFDGHVSAFEYFGGVPEEILYDNATTLVKKIHKYGERELTKKFHELKSHYLFEAIFANPAKGNEKGKVENKVGYVRRNFLVPKPRYNSIEELNNYLKESCESRRKQKHHKDAGTIGERVIKEQESFLKLPEYPYESCDIKLSKVNSYSLVCYKTNEYSVPTNYAYKNVTLKAYSEKIRIFYKDKEIAQHKRSFKRNEQNYDYLHYLPILSQKSRALDQAKPLQDLNLPKEFEKLRNALENKYEGSKGKREYIKILELLGHHSQDDIKSAIAESFKIGVINVDSIKQIIHHKRDVKIESLDKEILVDIPVVTVHAPSLEQYNSFLKNN
jgi:transposase